LNPLHAIKRVENFHVAAKLLLGQTLGVSQSLYKVDKIIKVTALDNINC